MTAKTIILTRPISDNDSLAQSLQQDGIQLISFPTIDIEYVKTEIIVEGFSHIVFTSQHGVHGFFENLKEQLHNNVKLCCIGKKTAQSLERYCFKAQIVSGNETAEDFALELIKHVSPNDNILLPLGNLAGTMIENHLSKICNVTRINVYNTIAPKFINQDVLIQIKVLLFDCVVFTSPSTFANFIQITKLKPDNLQGKIACIGKTTAAMVTQMGFHPDMISSSAKGEVFAREIIEYFCK